MKRIKTCLVVTLLIALGVPTPAATQTAPPTSAIFRSATVPSGNGSDQAAPAREVFKVGVSVRLRTEIRDDFKFGSTNPGNDEQYLLTQSRVNATWNPATRATVFVEIQDARIFGEEGIDQNATPNIFADELELPKATCKSICPRVSFPWTLRSVVRSSTWATNGSSHLWSGSTPPGSGTGSASMWGEPTSEH